MSTKIKHPQNRWRYGIPGVGPLFAIHDSNVEHSKNKKKLKKQIKSNLTEKDKQDIKKESAIESLSVKSGQYKRVKKDGKTVLQKVNKNKNNKNKNNKNKNNKKVDKKDPVTKTRPRPGSAGARIQQQLMDAGFSRESLDAKTDRHAAWKKARKEGTLRDWEKTYHPDRTPQYRNKNKNKSSRNKLKVGNTESTKTGSLKHKPGAPNSQFNKDGSKKTKNNPLSISELPSYIPKKQKKKNKKMIGKRLAANFD